MTGQNKHHKRDDEPISALSRRDFIALSLAAGLAAAAGSVSGTELPVIETNVDVKTPDGICDAVLIHPAKGSHPEVLLCAPLPPGLDHKSRSGVRNALSEQPSTQPSTPPYSRRVLRRVLCPG